ncbi:MAG: DUF3857 domain-containing transglutaminase family protein [Acidobacteriota bacterium]|nr:MAG: DUF3857 domain-containing transglutaminase family protein [Acidobacteriota bacterium]
MRRESGTCGRCWVIAAMLLALLSLDTSGARATSVPVLPPGDEPPPTEMTRLAAAGDAEDYPGFDHVIVHDVTTNRIDERGVTTTEGYQLSKVLTPRGCRDLAVMRWGYDPQSSWVDVREVNILRDGEKITVSVDDVVDLPAPQAAIYWRDRVKLLQLPRLRVGDGIEVRTYRKGFTYALLEQAGEAASGGGREPDDERFIPPMPGEYFDIVLFQADVPTLEKRYEVYLPAAKRLHSRVYQGALSSSTSYTADENVYAWWGVDLPARPHEPRQPAASDIVTKVVLATVESWEAKSRWFFDVNEGQFDSSPEIDLKVRQILEETGVAGGSEEQKAEALLHWVAQNIRYSGQTMGKGEGFTLHPGTMIFEQRSGVCKDIAGMLVTMMRAADIPAFAAMTMAGSRIEEVPADQFNHCVVARQDGEDWVMYDPTWVPYNNDIWSKLETEQHFLIGSPGGETLQQIAYSPPAESPLTVRHDATLSPDGSLEGEIRFEGGGAVDSRLRRLLTRTPQRRLTERFAQILEPMCPRIDDVRITHGVVDDFSADIWVEIRYRAPEFAMKVKGGLEFTSPLMAVLLGEGLLFPAGAQNWAEERETDVFLYYTQLVDLVETIRLPRGLTASVIPESRTVDETYAFFSGSGEAEAGSLVIRSRAEVRRRQIPPTGYAGFRAAMQGARNWAQAVFRAGEAAQKENRR